VPARLTADLDAGRAVQVRLVHTLAGKRYPQRWLVPVGGEGGGSGGGGGGVEVGTTPQTVELAAVLYFNVHYTNNGKILREWIGFQQLQGVQHFYVYFYSDGHFVCKMCSESHRAEDPVGMAIRGCDLLEHPDKPPPAECSDKVRDEEPEEWVGRGCSPRWHVEPAEAMADILPLVEAGLVTLVEWPMNHLCAKVDSDQAFCQACSNGGRQTAVVNYHLNRYRDFSTFTVFCDVDEWLFAFGGTLPLLRQELKLDPDLVAVGAPYNNWFLDNSTARTPSADAHTDLYVSKLNRYYFDPGFGKYIAVNKNAWSGNIHGASGPESAREPVTVSSQCTAGGRRGTRTLQQVLRTNHHRHGAAGPGSEEYQSDLKERLHNGGASPADAWEAVYGVLLPCLQALADTPPAALAAGGIAALEAIAHPCWTASGCSVYPEGQADGSRTHDDVLADERAEAEAEAETEAARL
jgi:hypothetical protein